MSPDKKLPRSGIKNLPASKTNLKKKHTQTIFPTMNFQFLGKNEIDPKWKRIVQRRESLGTVTVDELGYLVNPAKAQGQLALLFTQVINTWMIGKCTVTHIHAIGI